MNDAARRRASANGGVLALYKLVRLARLQVEEVQDLDVPFPAIEGKDCLRGFRERLVALLLDLEEFQDINNEGWRFGVPPVIKTPAIPYEQCESDTRDMLQE